jgi:hypothetical protein
MQAIALDTRAQEMAGSYFQQSSGFRSGGIGSWRERDFNNVIAFAFGDLAYC